MKETYNGIWREIASRIRLHLRGCVKVSSRCETVENKACCSDVDKRLRSLHAVLVVLTQASIAAKPSEAALYNPGEACDLERTLPTFDDLELPTILLQQVSSELATLVSGIRYDCANVREQCTQATEQQGSRPSASLCVDRLKFFGCHPGTSVRLPKFQFGPHHGLQTIKSHGKTNFLGDLEHAVVFGQDKPENALKPFLPADVDKKLQKATSEPLSLEAITDFYGELCLGHTMSLNQPAHANNLGFFHLRFLPNRYQSHFPVVVDETDSGQSFMGDTQLELLLSKVTEKHGLLGQRTVKLEHQRFILRPDRPNDNRSSVPKFPRTGILLGIGPNRQARQICFWDALVVQNNPCI